MKTVAWIIICAAITAIFSVAAIVCFVLLPTQPRPEPVPSPTITEPAFPPRCDECAGALEETGEVAASLPPCVQYQCAKCAKRIWLTDPHDMRATVELLERRVRQSRAWAERQINEENRSSLR